MKNYQLSNLLDWTIIQDMADAYCRAEGIAIGIVDAVDGTFLARSAWQEICGKFHRTNPASRERCRESKICANEKITGSANCHYQCKNGLRHIDIPIVVRGHHLATLFLAQFFYEDDVPERDLFIRQAHEYGFDVDAYLAALEQVPVLNRDRIGHILEYHESVAKFIADLAERAFLKTEADEAVRQSERKFHAIFDQAHQFFALLSTDGGVLEVNQTAMTFCGAKDKEVIGRPFWETPWWTHSPELQEKVREAVHKAAKGEFIRFEATHPATDGSLHNIDFSLKPITDADGRVVLLMPEGRDITQHKLAREKIKRQADFLQLLIDTMPYPIFYKNHQGRYLGCNHAFEQFYEVSREQLAGKTVYDTDSKELADRFQQTDDELFSHPGTQTYEGQLQSADGALHDVIFHKATFDGPDGEVAGLVGTVIDITERKRAETEKQRLQDRLALAQKMESVGRLAGGVAHDFNNMLGVILGNGEMALTKVGPTHPLLRNLDEIQKAAKRSAALTGQLLAFARKQTVTPRVLSLNETVYKMFTMLQRLIGEDIDLAWIPDPDLWTVKVDPVQVDQILMNLAANARDSIAEVGKVSIETRNVTADEAYCATHIGIVPGDYVMLAMSDNGCGMDRQTLTNIFDPFFTTKGPGKGTGLGLATVYGIVRQNNGVINVYSEPGDGTSFKIYLPRYLGNITCSLPEEPAEAAAGGPETVLLVEDEPMLLRLAQTMLEKLGYPVLVAATPGEAIRLAQEHGGEIHLLMTDVVMPEMNGHDLANCLISIYPNLKRLFMSGYTANFIAHHGVLEENVHFIQKPFSMKDLANKVRQALEHK